MKKRSTFVVITFILIVACMTMYMGAVDFEDKGETSIFKIMRASNSFEVEIPAGEIMKADTSFSLGVGDTVTVRAVYTPKSANLDVGLIATEGLFYSVRETKGEIDSSISVNKRGKYTLAIRNNSDVDVTVTGIVDY